MPVRNPILPLTHVTVATARHPLRAATWVATQTWRGTHVALRTAGRLVAVLRGQTSAAAPAPELLPAEPESRAPLPPESSELSDPLDLRHADTSIDRAAADVTVEVTPADIAPAVTRRPRSGPARNLGPGDTLPPRRRRPSATPAPE